MNDLKLLGLLLCVFISIPAISGPTLGTKITRIPIYYLTDTIYAVESTTPECATGDMTGGTTTSQETICCAVQTNTNGTSTCIGYETCSQKTVQCLDMTRENGNSGNYSVKGDPFNCTRDSACGNGSVENDFEILVVE